MSGYPRISFTKLGYACLNEISQFDLSQGFIFDNNLRYPKITREIRYTQVFVTLANGTFQTHLLRTPLRTTGY